MEHVECLCANCKPEPEPQPTGEERRGLILSTIEDLVGDFLYYDREEDEELPVGSIEAAIAEREITKTEIVEHFKRMLVL